MRPWRSLKGYNTYYFILSGKYPGLAQGELNALLEIMFGKKQYSTWNFTQLTLLSTNKYAEDEVKNIIKRSGLIKEAGKVINICDQHNFKELYECIVNAVEDYVEEDQVYKISILNIKGLRHIDKNAILEIIRLKTGIRIYYKSNKHIRIVFSNGLTIVGIKLYALDTRSFYKRRPSIRPFFRSIAMPVDMSRALVNLSRLREGQIFLDPFLGTGSIAIEAALIGGRVIGLDINWEMVKGALNNMKYIGLKTPIVIGGDATHLPIKEVDAIATDPPYGRSASTYGVDVKKVYRGFIENAYTVLKDKRYLVLIAPDRLQDFVEKILCENGFILKKKYPIYIHRGLTRIIYVAYKP
ncbi:MAG: RsmD family RNA methyltransferase [Desulfurococcales archaeon]|nr:RsmD family RNA methyltransferase [Desulfurococcales archaeon]